MARRFPLPLHHLTSSLYSIFLTLSSPIWKMVCECASAFSFWRSKTFLHHTFCKRLERLAPVCVIILWAGPYSFSSFSFFCFGTIFLLVALSSSAGELPRVSGLGWGTYWIEIPFPAPRSDISCMDIASSGMIERVTSLQMGRLQMTVKNKKSRL